VVARTSSFSFRDSGLPVRTIGDQLGVGIVVEGSIRKDGGRVRVTAQLIDVTDGFHLWSETYDRTERSTIAVEEEIADAIARQLALIRGPRKSAPRAELETPDPRAYEAYLLGRAESNLRTPESFQRAIAHYQRAVEIEPEYARAHAELASTYLQGHQWDGPEVLEAAESSARRALELDDSIAEAHAAMGRISWAKELNLSEAERYFLRAFELDPGYVAGMESYASVLAAVGRLPEALIATRRGLELDPVSPLMQRQVGRFYMYSGDYERAISHLWRSLELYPDDLFAPSLLWAAYEKLGRPAEAREALMLLAPAWTRPGLRALGRLIGTRTGLRIGLPLAIQVSGPPCTAHADSAAMIWAYLGEADRMFECLDYMFEQGSEPGYPKVHPFFEPYRTDPRFVMVLRRIGVE
jgi:tetratricopeptide (TPR) repeat protein